jgi:hypothetical protein
VVMVKNGGKLNPEHASVRSTATEFALFPASGRISPWLRSLSVRVTLEIEAEIPGAPPNLVAELTGKPNPENRRKFKTRSVNL